MAIAQSISALPEVPSISDTSSFEATAEAFLNSGLPQLRDEVNAWADQANALAAAVSAAVSGAAVSIGYVFSTATTDADPGAGKLRLGSATQNTATVIRADLSDVLGVDWTSVIDGFDDSTNPIKGHVMLLKTGDGSRWLLFIVSALTSPSGYRNITVSCVASSSASPFADGDGLVLKFTRTGDKGDTGAAGSAGATVAPNLLVNDGFAINQRLATSVTDATYDFDHWCVLTQTAAVATSQLGDPETGAPFGGRLSQSQATAQRFGRLQIVESRDCRHARSAAVAFSGRVRMSSAQTVRYAILEWTGTADAPTRDVVNDWTSGTYTGGNFFISTGVNVLQVGSLALSANTWTGFSLTATCGASMNNLIVFVWTEAVQAQNATLDLDSCKLEVGSSPTPWQPRPIAEELLLCQRYYEKTFELGQIPGSNKGTAGAFAGVQVVSSPDDQQFPSSYRFRVPKPAIPTVTLYNPSSAGAQVRNVSAGSSWSGTSSAPHTQTIGIGGGVSGSAGALCAIHFTAEAEF